MNFKKEYNEGHRSGGFTEQLYCPLCNMQDTHLEKTEDGSIDGRLAVKLHFSCESGCKFTYLIYNHKGSTLYLLVEGTEAVHIEPDLPRCVADSLNEGFTQEERDLHKSFAGKV